MQQNQVQRTQSEATSLRKIIDSGVKLRDLKNDNPIREALLTAYVQVGLKPENYPKEGIERDMLHNFVINTYGDITAQEIKIAFTRAVAHKFDGLDPVCYHQNFTCEYFGRIMSAYYKWRTTELRKPQVNADEPIQDMDDKQWFNTMLIEPYQEMLKGGVYPWTIFQEVIIFTRLWEIGFRFVFTQQESDELEIEAKKITPKPKGLMTIDKKRDFQKEVERIKKALCFRKKIQEKAIKEFDLRTHVMNRLNKSSK